MSVAQVYRGKAGELVHLASQATTSADRDRYFREAAHWHTKALEAEVLLGPHRPEPRSWKPRF
jgi:hypothetical protein